MQRIVLLFSVLVVCFVTALQAQTAAPKPAPEWKQWHGVLGHWTYTCDYRATPFGPASQAVGEYTAQMVLGGFFLKEQFKEKGPSGVSEGFDVARYDAANKNFVISGYENDGSTYGGTDTVSGNTFTGAEKVSVGDKQYDVRLTATYSADWTTGDWKAELSSDGKTWAPWFEQKMTKVKPAAKK
jgi:opacity protein-like surface antigen